MTGLTLSLTIVTGLCMAAVDHLVCPARHLRISQLPLLLLGDSWREAQSRPVMVDCTTPVTHGHPHWHSWWQTHPSTIWTAHAQSITGSSVVTGIRRIWSTAICWIWSATIGWIWSATIGWIWSAAIGWIRSASTCWIWSATFCWIWSATICRIWSATICWIWPAEVCWLWTASVLAPTAAKTLRPFVHKSNIWTVLLCLEQDWITTENWGTCIESRPTVKIIALPIFATSLH